MTTAGSRDPRGRAGAMGAIPLFPSGEDANPLNRRLPAEVITRRRREIKKPEEKTSDEVKVDLKTALSLKPEARLKWLSKAFKMVEESRAAATELFDILSSRKFATGVPSKICRKLRTVVYESESLFSDKQRRYLKSDEWALNASCGDGGVERDTEKDKDEDEDDKPQLDPKTVAKQSRPSQLPAWTTLRPVSVCLADERKRSDVLASDVRDKSKPVPVAKIQMDAGGVWMEAEDAAARQREQALERARRDAARAREHAKRQTLEREAQSRAEAEECKRRELEDQVDDSLMLLERLAEKRQQAQPEERKRKEKSRSRSRSRGRGSRRKRDRRKTSRSISVGSRSRSRRKSGKGKDRVDFSEALARRMREREGDLDSARMPVVDPGHAKRHLAGLQ